MTNEEAIKRLNKIKAIYKGMDNKSDVKALEMAIKTLEQTDGDLYRCSICGRSIILYKGVSPKIHPYCCNTKMKPIVMGDLIAEIDKLPRIKVGNSNSPTVKYCIDENLIYDLIERYKGEAVGEMTKEEAIEIIEGRNFYCIECIDRSDECCKALDMAIKALSAESVKPIVYCKDCKFQDDIKGCIRLNVFVDKNTFYCEYGMRKEQANDTN